MADNPISCPPRYDRFLAVTETMPYELEVPRKTAAEKEKARKQSIACISESKKIRFEV